MSLYNDFARRDQADQYNSALFSLINYLCIRVGMTVKQSKSQTTHPFLNPSFLISETDPSQTHPQEFKLFKHIQYQIKKLKSLESDKHNPPNFSMATQKLTKNLDVFMEAYKDTTTSNGKTPSVMNSSFSSFNGHSINSNIINMKSKTSLLSMQ